MKNLFIILILCSSFLQAQDIAYVDSRYILENIPEFSTTQEELNNISTEWQEEIDQMKDEGERLYRQYQAKQYIK